jgi:hypothetical protein
VASGVVSGLRSFLCSMDREAVCIQSVRT